MKVLHLSKTSRGARWASSQARVLVERGVEVCVVLPDVNGPVAAEWIANGAKVHCMPYTFSPARPLETIRSLDALRRIVDRIQPDLVHSHSVIAAMMARLALRNHPSLARIFQVPGPIHMEKLLFRKMELSTATGADYWIATSRAIKSLYLAAGIAPERVFLSYAGTDNARFREPRSGWLRRRLGLKDTDFIVGNVSYIYSPKWFLLQSRGLKCHEDLIDGITLAAKKDASIKGVLIGGPWEADSRYFDKVREYARKRSGGAVLMPGPMNQQEVANAMPDIDCVAHVPLSENCGGVVEPLLCEIPTIASQVGGLGEVVMDRRTGITVPVHSPEALSQAILQVRNHYNHGLALASAGRHLVQSMFDVNRTAVEVHEIYRYLLGERQAPPDEFSSCAFLDTAKRHSQTEVCATRHP